MKAVSLNRFLRLMPALALLLLAGCPTQTHIADIHSNPSSFRGKEIALVGTASEPFAFMGQGAFHLDDGTGQIWVLTGNYGLPGNGVKVAVVDNVVNAISFGPRSFGTAVQLTQKPRY